MRLVAFVGVIALIVGTSVSLASADDRSAATPPAKTTPVAKVTTVAKSAPDAKVMTVAKAAPDAKESTAPADADETADVVEAADVVAVDPAATAGSASGELPQASLPLTGDVHVRWLMIGGAMLVLVGMLVQVAGQPLPARARR